MKLSIKDNTQQTVSVSVEKSDPYYEAVKLLNAEGFLNATQKLVYGAQHNEMPWVHFFAQGRRGALLAQLDISAKNYNDVVEGISPI